MMKTAKIEKAAAILLPLAVMLFAFCWAVIQPLNASPDEEMRFQVIQYMFDHNALPHGDDPEIRHGLWGISYAFNPYLSGMISVLFMKLAACFTSDAAVLLRAARLTEILCTGATVWMTIKIAGRLWSGWVKWLFVSLIAFLPQFLFLGSYLNNDALAIFSTAWMFYLWIKALQEGWSWGTCIQLGIAVSICALSYYNAYSMVLCSVVFFVVTMLLCGEKKWDFRQMITKGLGITGIVCLLAGWFFIRNYIIYDGDFLGNSISTECAELYAIDELKPSNRITPVRMGMSLIGMFFWVPEGWNGNWMKTVFSSFVGTFGFMTVFLPDLIYKIFMCIYGVGALGALPLLRHIFRPDYRSYSKEKRREGEYWISVVKVKKGFPWNGQTVFHQVCVLGVIIPICLLVYYAYTQDFQAQGRYIMPMLFPFMYFVTRGIEKAADRLIRRERLRRALYMALIAFLVFAALYAYFAAFLPYIATL